MVAVRYLTTLSRITSAGAKKALWHSLPSIDIADFVTFYSFQQQRIYKVAIAIRPGKAIYYFLGRFNISLSDTQVSRICMQSHAHKKRNC